MNNYITFLSTRIDGYGDELVEYLEEVLVSDEWKERKEGIRKKIGLGKKYD